MIAVYGFCAVVGGVLALLMIFGGGDADVDADLDFDPDLDFDADVDMEGGPGVGSALASLFSFRTIVFSLAFFGITGLVLPLVGAGSAFTLVASIMMGVVAGAANDQVVRYVKRTSGGVDTTSASLAGTPARVTVPVDSGRRGRVVLEVEGRTLNLVAEPFVEGATFARDDTVVVIEVRKGVARIAPFELMA